MVTIDVLPCLNDNYFFALPTGANQCALVDPGDYAAARLYLDQTRKQLSALLITHGHSDHIGGLAQLAKETPGLLIYGPKSVSGVTKAVTEGAIVTLGEDEVQMTVWETPGHCPEHLSFLGDGFVFCGDTLFTSGCGRVFGSSPELLYASLQRYKTLPPDTQLYCGHEYTASNVAFAEKVLPHDEKLKLYKEVILNKRETSEATVPTTLSSECTHNVFLRTDEESIQAAISELCPGQQLTTAQGYFVALRELKDKGL